MRAKVLERTLKAVGYAAARQVIGEPPRAFEECRLEECARILVVRQPAISWRVWVTILRSTCIESIRPRLPKRMSFASARLAWNGDETRGTILSYWIPVGVSTLTTS